MRYPERVHNVDNSHVQKLQLKPPWFGNELRFFSFKLMAGVAATKPNGFRARRFLQALGLDPYLKAPET